MFIYWCPLNHDINRLIDTYISKHWNLGLGVVNCIKTLEFRSRGGQLYQNIGIQVQGWPTVSKHRNLGVGVVNCIKTQEFRCRGGQLYQNIGIQIQCGQLYQKIVIQIQGWSTVSKHRNFGLGVKHWNVGLGVVNCIKTQEFKCRDGQLYQNIGIQDQGWSTVSKHSNLSVGMVNCIINFKHNLIEDYYWQNQCFNINMCYVCKRIKESKRKRLNRVKEIISFKVDKSQHENVYFD